MTLEDESALIEGILRNDEECVVRFVREFQDMVYAQSMRMLKNSMDAEEVSQDVFLKAFRRLEKFERRSKLSTWLYSITYKSCLDSLKKQKRRGHEVDVEQAEGHDWEQIADSLSLLEAQEQRDLINDALGKLSPSDAMLIDLYYLQGIPTKEITEITKMSSGNIRIRMMRARQKLADILSQTLPQETIEQYRYGRE
ncbi:MAG: RNA polymerase sigma factor [Flavobacteriales bacterium]|nr:RNA polymerase sigma factor [Flavobacteriales bacterium]